MLGSSIMPRQYHYDIIDLLRKKNVDLEAMITDRFPFERIRGPAPLRYRRYGQGGHRSINPAPQTSKEIAAIPFQENRNHIAPSKAFRVKLHRGGPFLRLGERRKYML